MKKGSIMKYFGQGNDYINAECEKCGRILKVQRHICSEVNDKYTISQPIKCVCGNESSEIIKPTPIQEKAITPPKKKGFWSQVFSNVNEEKGRRTDEPIRCPKCGSTQITADKKGFSTGKAFAGDLIAGPIGILAGSIGSKKVIITCLNCGHKWEAGKRR